MMPNLGKEWLSATRGSNYAASRHLCDDFGIFPVMERKLAGACIGAAQVEFFNDGGYEPSPAGSWALLIASSITAAGDPEDIIAFDPKNPKRMHRRSGIVNWLGEWNLYRRAITWSDGYHAPVCASDEYTNDTLEIYDNALEWVRDYCKGSLPLCRKALYQLRTLRPGISITATNLPLAERIHAFLEKPYPDQPQVRVRADRLGDVA